ncbi:Hpt domain-containing protein [Maricaulis sp. CAU 1757]
MSEWQQQPEINDAIVDGLIGAVGADVFRSMTEQFADDLCSLASKYEQARAGGDRAEAQSAAHALKGAAANIGLQRVSALATHLEAGDMHAADQLKPVLDQSLQRLRERS